MKLMVIQACQLLWPALPVWRRLDLTVLGVAIYSASVYFFISQVGLEVPQLNAGLAIANTVVLSVLLGFRNVQAYDRWWEGRKLWGQLINDSRNLAVKTRTFVNLTPDERQKLGECIVGFAIALKNHLRGLKTLQRVPGWEGDPAKPPHVPLYITARTYDLLRGFLSKNRISATEMLLIDPHAKAFMDISGACERIQNTPVPTSYRALLRHGTVLYILSAPWFLGNLNTGYWIVPIVALITYFLMGIEFTAEDVEDPFGKDGDDLDLSRYCETIQAGVEQALDIRLIPMEKTLGF
ncbi:MAG: bestrophin family protein [Gemmataceae bacterium]